MDRRVVLKRIMQFKVGEDIPHNAKFVGTGNGHSHGGSIKYPLFFYEVPDKIERSSTKTQENFKQEIDTIITYLNRATDSKYSLKTEKTRLLIFKWLKQDKTVGDFYVAIDNMVDLWLNDPKMRQYLRPETLFGSKFEGYLNKGSSPSEGDIFGELEDFM